MRFYLLKKCNHVVQWWCFGLKRMWHQFLEFLILFVINNYSTGKAGSFVYVDSSRWRHANVFIHAHKHSFFTITDTQNVCNLQSEAVKVLTKTVESLMIMTFSHSSTLALAVSYTHILSQTHSFSLSFTQTFIHSHSLSFTLDLPLTVSLKSHDHSLNSCQ